MKLYQACSLIILLSLTATSPAIAKLAKTGCNDTCGNVTIPYPFGIGEECSINQWYVIDCNSFTPYLRALNNLVVLNVSLRDRTATVSTPRITDCQNPVLNSSEMMGVDLDTSPFFFSNLNHNKFVFEGCGTAVLMNGGSVVTGCSTSCRNDTPSDTNNCFGITCCETAIPDPLKSYSINLTGLVENGACGSAFLVDRTSYDQGRFNVTNTSSPNIPISLRWILADSDQATCCNNETPNKYKVRLYNGTLMDTWRCLFYTTSLEENPYLTDGCSGMYFSISY
ncbi:hypothetical protein SSX86_019515 [Deinandra increscens subsp. villosa]|uniref:Wall-associated receptor kinase galacturonan-binding domain-containing protein n=1 Tax=Deinandra increscens subsp. villosa TaxID=3103831 RepID=A0AAP0CSZ9_9ASTR